MLFWSNANTVLLLFRISLLHNTRRYLETCHLSQPAFWRSNIDIHRIFICLVSWSRFGSLRYLKDTMTKPMDWHYYVNSSLLYALHRLVKPTECGKMLRECTHELTNMPLYPCRWLLRLSLWQEHVLAYIHQQCRWYSSPQYPVCEFLMCVGETSG